MTESYIHKDYYRLLDVIKEVGWNSKVIHQNAIRPVTPYVEVHASPEPDSYDGDYDSPDVEVIVTWHTYGAPEGTYGLWSCEIYPGGQSFMEDPSFEDVLKFMGEGVNND